MNFSIWLYLKHHHLFLITDLISLPVVFVSILVACVFVGIFLFHLSYLIYWYTVLHSIPLQVFLFLLG